MYRTLQTSEAQDLSAAVRPLNDGYHFMFTARAKQTKSTEEHVKFQCLFSADELRALRDLIDIQLRSN